MLRTLLTYSVLLLLLLSPRPASAKKPHWPPPAKTRFLDATVQRTIPGLRGAEPTTEWKFLLIWNEAQPPKRFLWVPGGESPLDCAVQKIHHYTKAGEQSPKAYGSKAIALKAVRRGDTLEIIPIPHTQGSWGRSMKGAQAEGLYYQTSVNTSWKSLRPALRRQKDIIMQ
jgi:hypothetical protein